DALAWGRGNLAPDSGQALAAPVCPAISDRDRAALDPTEVVEPPRECGRPLAFRQRCAVAQEPDNWSLPRLLRPRRERPRCRTAAQKRDELAPFHFPIPPVLRTKDRIAQHCCAAGFQCSLCLLRVEAGKRKRLDGLYSIDISSMNLRHHWNASSRTSTADVSDLPSVIHSSEACAV